MPKKSKTEIVPADEALAQDWSDAREMLDKVKLHGRLFLLGQVLLGWKLQNLKKTLGFQAGGDRKSKCQLGTLNGTWEQHLESELGISKRTAYRFEESFEGARAKMKRLGGFSRALTLLNQDPTKLDEEAAKTVEGLVAKITDGETQRGLLEELKLVKQPPKGNGGHNPRKEPKEEETEQQLAFAFVTHPMQVLAEMRLDKDFAHTLHVLPLHGNEETNQPGLLDMKSQLEATLFEVNQVLEAKKQK